MQADLNLRWELMSKVTFSDIATYVQPYFENFRCFPYTIPVLLDFVWFPTLLSGAVPWSVLGNQLSLCLEVLSSLQR